MKKVLIVLLAIVLFAGLSLAHREESDSEIESEVNSESGVVAEEKQGVFYGFLDYAELVEEVSALSSAASFSAQAIDKNQITLLMAQLAEAVYVQPLKLGTRPSFSLDGKCERLQVIGSVDDGDFVAKVFAAPVLQAAILDFRGTKTLNNVITDIKTFKTDCSFDGLDCGRVHLGMNKMYKEYRSDLHKTIRGYLQGNRRIKTLYIVGHSLGGGLSNLAGVDFANSLPRDVQINVVTFGSPRVGDDDFVEMFESFAPRLTSVRYVNTKKAILFTASDMVTGLPATFTGFSHVGDPANLKCSVCKVTNPLSMHKMVNYIQSVNRNLADESLIKC